MGLSQQVCRWHKAKRYSWDWCSWGKGCHPGGPWQPWGMELLHGQVQDPAVESGQSPVSLQTRGLMGWEQPQGEGLGQTGVGKFGHEPAMGTFRTKSTTSDLCPAVWFSPSTPLLQDLTRSTASSSWIQSAWKTWMDLLEWIQRTAIKVVIRLELFSYKERLNWGCWT